MRKLELVAAILAIIALVGTPAASFAYESYLRSEQAHEFTLVGQDAEWNMTTIRVREGDLVRLRITSADVIHGFEIDGLEVEADEVYPGKFVALEFTASKPGTFEFVCTVRCDDERSVHKKMTGELIVEAA
jgi:cytochrome c oxidase subunit II